MIAVVQMGSPVHDAGTSPRAIPLSRRAETARFFQIPASLVCPGFAGSLRISSPEGFMSMRIFKECIMLPSDSASPHNLLEPQQALLRGFPDRYICRTAKKLARQKIFLPGTGKTCGRKGTCGFCSDCPCLTRQGCFHASSS